MPLVIKQIINCPSDLKREFMRMNRDNFSYEGYQALIDYFDDLDDGETDLDVISICCDFTEDSVDDFIREYDIGVLSFEGWCEDQDIKPEDQDCFEGEYEEYKIETIREYADSKLGFYRLLNDDTSIIYSA